MSASVHQLKPKFPTPVERALLDLPLPDDDELTIPPFDSFNPFGSRAQSHPDSARKSGRVDRMLPLLRRGLRFIWGIVQVAGYGLFGALILYVLAFLATVMP